MANATVEYIASQIQQHGGVDGSERDLNGWGQIEISQAYALVAQRKAAAFTEARVSHFEEPPAPPSAENIADALLDASAAQERANYAAEVSRPIPFNPASQESKGIGLPALVMGLAALIEFAN